MNTVKFTNLLVAVILLAAASCTPAQFVGGTGKLPKAKEGTRLRQIQDRGKLIAGVKYDVPTFGFLDPATKQLSGFDIDLVRAIAAHIFGDPQAVE
ncbi:MAG: amino acid ABC transporter substrate-binding protein, partial [Chloroflexi bacterium]|nr:amino acid ABC transporter substrate-binding protein [Chloroflexota bacterium]